MLLFTLKEHSPKPSILSLQERFQDTTTSYGHRDQQCHMTKDTSTNAKQETGIFRSKIKNLGYSSKADTTSNQHFSSGYSSKETGGPATYGGGKVVTSTVYNPKKLTFGFGEIGYHPKIQRPSLLGNSVNSDKPITHGTVLEFVDFVDLYRSFSLRVRKDLKDLFEQFAVVQPAIERKMPGGYLQFLCFSSSKYFKMKTKLL